MKTKLIGIAIAGVLALVMGTTAWADSTPVSVTPQVGVISSPTTFTVDNETGNNDDQTDAHISGDKVSYTSENNGGSEIRVYSIATNSHVTIPTNGGMDFLSDVDGSTAVYTHLTNDSEVWAYDISQGTAAQLDPVAEGNRRWAHIGGQTVAWQDFTYTQNISTPEITVYDLGTQVATRLTDDDLLDRDVNVSPDGKTVVWTKCQQDDTQCAIWESVNDGTGWSTPIQLTVTDQGEADDVPHATTDGTTVVYSATRTIDGSKEKDIYWQPVGGGQEHRLVMTQRQDYPNISNGVVTFESLELGDPIPHFDVYVYDIATNTLYRVTDASYDQYLPDIWVSADRQVRVVWDALQADDNVYGEIFSLPALPDSLALSPTDGSQAAGTSETITATVKDSANQPVDNVPVEFAVSGAYADSGSCTTAADGTCTFTYGPAGVGDVSIDAYADTNANGWQDSGEPGATATRSLVAADLCTAVCYVNGNTGSDTANDGKSPGNAFATIQMAADTVEDGGTVIVSAGTYNESVTIDHGMTLKGYKAGWDARYRTPSFGGETIVVSDNDRDAFDVDTDESVIIDGFTFQDSYGGIWLHSEGGNAITGVQVINNIFRNNSTALIIGDDGDVYSSLTIRHNLFDHNNNATFDLEPGDGIWLNHDASIDDPDGASVIDANTFTGQSYAAIDLENGQVSGLDITNNSSNGDAAFALLANVSDSGISGNTISNSTGDAIELQDGIAALQITSNTITSAAGAGILFNGEAAGSSGVTVTNNTFSMDRYGIDIMSGLAPGFNGPSLYVHNNTFKAAKTAAIAVDEGVDTSGLLVRTNSIAGNAAGVINTSGDEFDATCNWWGTSTGPRSNSTNGFGDSVSGLGIASFAPWLTSSNLNQPCDTSAPDVTFFTPADGTTYKLHQNVRPVFRCTDAGSGVASCLVTGGGSQYALDTSSTGPHTFEVTVTDKAGNTTISSVSYNVVAP